MVYLTAVLCMVNRKMLSEMAISDPEGFASLVETAKAKLG